MFQPLHLYMELKLTSRHGRLQGKFEGALSDRTGGAPERQNVRGSCEPRTRDSCSTENGQTCHAVSRGRHRDDRQANLPGNCFANAVVKASAMT